MADEKGTQDWEREKAWGKLVAKAWADDGFKQRLLADPAAVLREHGLVYPPGASVRVVEGGEHYYEVPHPSDRSKNAPYVAYLPLPAKPEGELSEQDLTGEAGGYGYCRGCGGCGYCRRCGGWCRSRCRC
jgi:Nitrile hydratase, alpha chain